MKMNLAHWMRLTVVVVAVAGTQVGCKSGWKMPGSDMFSWSKKPSESMLAGSSPSISTSSSSSSPMSPAQRNTPSPLYSTAANAGRQAPAGVNGGGNAPSFGSTNGPMANNTMMGGAGTSASANGYTSGPYGMASNQPRPGGYTPATGYGAPAGGAPMGYNSTANAPTNLGAGPSSFAASQQPSQGAPGFAPQNGMGGQPGMPRNNFAAATPSLPPAYGGQATTPGVSSAGTPSYAGFNQSQNGVPAMSVGFNQSSPNSLPPATGSSMPNAVQGGYQQTMPSVATQLPTSGYRPGSVGRPNNAYDFSNQGAGVQPTSGSSVSLPPATSYPSTANGLPSGSPNSVYR